MMLSIYILLLFHDYRDSKRFTKLSGDFFMAQVTSLALQFVCENNQWIKQVPPGGFKKYVDKRSARKSNTSNISWQITHLNWV